MESLHRDAGFSVKRLASGIGDAQISPGMTNSIQLDLFITWGNYKPAVKSAK